jgi:hypothetical protein
MDEETRDMLETVLELQKVVEEALEDIGRAKRKLKRAERLSSKLYDHFEGYIHL